jgi:hypothetical protein
MFRTLKKRKWIELPKPTLCRANVGLGTVRCKVLWSDRRFGGRSLETDRCETAGACMARSHACTCTYIHARMHTYTYRTYIAHTNTHAHIHAFTYKRTHTHACIHTYIARTNTHAHIPTCIHIQTHTHARTHTYIHCTYKHTHTCIHTYIHSHTNAHIHTYIHTRVWSLFCLERFIFVLFVGLFMWSSQRVWLCICIYILNAGKNFTRKTPQHFYYQVQLNWDERDLALVVVLFSRWEVASDQVDWYTPNESDFGARRNLRKR